MIAVLYSTIYFTNVQNILDILIFIGNMPASLTFLALAIWRMLFVVFVMLQTLGTLPMTNTVLFFAAANLQAIFQHAFHPLNVRNGRPAIHPCQLCVNGELVGPVESVSFKRYEARNAIAESFDTLPIF